jgi:hypothetical protein|uniref:Uncharacterized protein n=1 Tax=viral metagenome TaxID=1070528 RepID=A0A6C0JNJ1_9ZZZZ
MEYYSQKDRLIIVIDIINNLKNYKTKNGNTVNLYDSNLCSFINKFKEITNQYIKQDENNLKEFKGRLYFEEIDKYIEYNLPIYKYKQPLFVIRFKK